MTFAKRLNFRRHTRVSSYLPNQISYQTKFRTPKIIIHIKRINTPTSKLTPYTLRLQGDVDMKAIIATPSFKDIRSKLFTTTFPTL